MIKKSQTKSGLLVSLLFISAFCIPFGTVSAESQEFLFKDTLENMSYDQLINADDSIGNMMGGIFSSIGTSGGSEAALGHVLSLLFMNLANLSWDTTIPHCYTLYANYTTQEKWDESFNDNYTMWIDKDQYDDGSNQQHYVRVERTGTANITHTFGAAMVFIIWDPNGSFINAITRIITAFKSIADAATNVADPENPTQAEVDAALGAASNLLSEAFWLIMHINDIITGDELIITNLITWDTYTVESDSEYLAQARIWEFNQFSPDVLGDQGLATTWLAEAEANDDDYMKWLMNAVITPNIDGENTKEWSQFTFNLLEIWLKTFQIHINASAIYNLLSDSTSGSGSSTAEINPATIFQGLEIDIFLMTHSFVGIFAYNDSLIANGVPDVQYTPVEFDGNDDGINETHYVPTGSEIDYYFVMKDVSEWQFQIPTVLSDNGTPENLTWGIKAVQPVLAAIPIGGDPKDVDLIDEVLSEFSMGFTFSPETNVDVLDAAEYEGLVEVAEAVEVMGSAVIKLDTKIGNWNSDGGINNGNLTGYDLALVFVTTIIHVHIKVDTEVIDDTSAGLMEEGVSESVNESGSIKIGNNETNLPLAAVDIAGPDYTLTGGPSSVSESHPANTCTIPLVMLDYQANSTMTNVNTTNPNQSYSVEGLFEVEAGVMIYAVSYPDFGETNGAEIWHDPTFSVFMEWEDPFIWAWILVFGSITLVGVAAIMITKRKNQR